MPSKDERASRTVDFGLKLLVPGQNPTVEYYIRVPRVPSLG